MEQLNKEFIEFVLNSFDKKRELFLQKINSMGQRTHWVILELLKG